VPCSKPAWAKSARSCSRTCKEGTVVKGIVKNITDYGAFVDLGGIDGLLHITDLAWRRVRHPSEVLNVGDEVTAKVLKFDQEKNRVSLGMKQLGEDPWVGIARRYPQGTRLFGKVTNLTDYGCFVEIEQGIEGLVHVSEMDWTNKNIHPSKVVQLGDEVEVMILEIDEDRRRISLGMKQCMANPWDDFAMNHKKGDKVRGADQVDHRLRHLHRPARRHRRPGAPVRPVLVRTGEEAKRTSRRATKSRPWCCPSMSRRSAFRSASSSSMATPSPASWPPTTRTAWSPARSSVDQRARGRPGLRSRRLPACSEFSRDRIEDLTQHLKVGDR
jgi:small subunit ribosomal protein S1